MTEANGIASPTARRLYLVLARLPPVLGHFSDTSEGEVYRLKSIDLKMSGSAVLQSLTPESRGRAVTL